MVDDPIFFLPQYFECKKAVIEWILNKVSIYIILSSNILPRRRGLGRVFIFDFIVNVANDMWNLGFKGLLHILMNPIFFLFSSHIASSCNITSV